MKILVVDDDPQLLNAVSIAISLQWPVAEVLGARDGDEALDRFFQEGPDLVLLDLTLPRKSGYEVLQAIRRVSDVPVIILTARGEELDQVRGLQLGADDYVVKPFGHLALLARVKAVLRRAKLPAPVAGAPGFVSGDLAIDFGSHQVTVKGQPIPLTPIEYKLLYHLARNVGHLLPHRALLDRVWSDDDATTDHLKVYISRLRAKLEAPFRLHLIETERGLGYRLIRSQTITPRLPSSTSRETFV